VHFRRTGGLFAGNRVELDVSQEELDPAGAEALARVLDSPGPARFTELPGKGVGADEYQYDLTIRRGEEVVSLRFDESRLPPELVPLVGALEHAAAFTAEHGVAVSPATMSRAIASLPADDPGQGRTARGRQRRPGRPLKRKA
jgi:hypothetical protein